MLELHQEVADNNNLVGRAATDLATKVRRIGDTSSQRYAELTYSGEEAYAEVFIAAPDVSTGSGGTAVEIKTVKDTEVDSIKSKNLIVIGGSCINTVAAKLL